MGFWKWYLKGIGTLILKAISFKWVAHPLSESFLGTSILIGGLIWLLNFNLGIWLLLTIPIGATLMVHAFYRD